MGVELLVILVRRGRRRSHCWGGGISGQLLVLSLVVHVSQAVVEMVVGVIVDLGGDNCTHERRPVGYTGQGAPASRRPWRGKFAKNRLSNKSRQGNLGGRRAPAELEAHRGGWLQGGRWGSIACTRRTCGVQLLLKHNSYLVMFRL